MDRRSIATALYFFLALMLLMLMRDWMSAARETEYVPYSRFQQLLDENAVARVAILDDTIEGELKQKSSEGFTRFVTNRVDADLSKLLSEHNVEYGAVHRSRAFETLVAWVAPALIFVGIWAFFMQRMAGRGMGPTAPASASRWRPSRTTSITRSTRTST
jgi:cell division protease FtsH